MLGNKANHYGQLEKKMMANKTQEIEGLGTGLHSLVDLSSLSPALHLTKHLLNIISLNLYGIWLQFWNKEKYVRILACKPDKIKG